MAIGLISGVLAGIFGVGGGIVMTPGIQVLLGAPPIVALATPLPVIFPTALAGALAYRRRGEVDVRAAAWLVGPGVVGRRAGSLAHDRDRYHGAADRDRSPPRLAGGLDPARGPATTIARPATAPILGGSGPWPASSPVSWVSVAVW